MAQDVAPLAEVYERHQEWPGDVAARVAEHLKSFLPGSGRAAFLGCATGVNDALPFARLARQASQVLASDVEPAYLAKLEERARAEGLSRVSVRRVDILQDLPALGVYDLVTLFFVIHRVPAWRKVAADLPRLIARGGSFFISEFAGPDGIIYLSNENGGAGQDPLSRLVRRYFELLPERFEPPLRSTRIGPFLDALGPLFAAEGSRDFAWPQSLTVAEMHRRIATGAYAPYFSVHPPRHVLDQLRSEFSHDWAERRDLTETIRIHRFRRV